MFLIPFIFAFYPELLLIKDAVIDPSSANSATTVFLPGYDGTVHMSALLLLIARLLLALYLISSVLAYYDSRPLTWFESGLRLLLAILLVVKSAAIYLPAIAVSIAVIVIHTYYSRRSTVASGTAM